MQKITSDIFNLRASFRLITVFKDITEKISKFWPSGMALLKNLRVMGSNPRRGNYFFGLGKIIFLIIFGRISFENFLMV
jgi:hypothetical protein